MTSSLIEKIDNLKIALSKDERIVRLNAIEEKMNKDEEVMKLAYQKDMALLDFEDALKHFPESSSEVKEAQNRLYKSKLSLDEHPLVKEYRLAYKEVQKIYSLINKELFGDFTSSFRSEFND